VPVVGNFTHPHDTRTNEALVISESMSVFISVNEAKFREKKATWKFYE
jgi:hypothetical protein